MEKFNTAPRLEALLRRLIMEERSALALRLVKTYLSMRAGANCTDPLIGQLLLTKTLRPDDKANIYLELARKMNEIQDFSLGDDYLAKAEEQFQACDHAIGAMETQFIILSRPGHNPSKITDQLLSLADRFRSMHTEPTKY